jgi:hypothetical protein
LGSKDGEHTEEEEGGRDGEQRCAKASAFSGGGILFYLLGRWHALDLAEHDKAAEGDQAQVLVEVERRRLREEPLVHREDGKHRYLAVLRRDGATQKSHTRKGRVRAWERCERGRGVAMGVERTACLRLDEATLGVDTRELDEELDVRVALDGVRHHLLQVHEQLRAVCTRPRTRPHAYTSYTYTS